jgi:hypothetical protein
MMKEQDDHRLQKIASIQQHPVRYKMDLFEGQLNLAITRK